MIWYIYQHSNKTFVIRPSALNGLGGKDFSESACGVIKHI